jgi:hypothetical protein
VKGILGKVLVILTHEDIATARTRNDATRPIAGDIEAIVNGDTVRAILGVIGHYLTLSYIC